MNAAFEAGVTSMHSFPAGSSVRRHESRQGAALKPGHACGTKTMCERSIIDDTQQSDDSRLTDLDDGTALLALLSTFLWPAPVISNGKS